MNPDEDCAEETDTSNLVPPVTTGSNAGNGKEMVMNNPAQRDFAKEHQPNFQSSEKVREEFPELHDFSENGRILCWPV